MNEPASGPPVVPLSPEVRAYLQARWDADAVEELLGTMPPAEQNAYLAQLGTPGFVQPGETTDVVVLIRSTDPARQALLDRIWAPYWDHLPADALDRSDLPYPGRELARIRREARDRDPGV